MATYYVDWVLFGRIRVQADCEHDAREQVHEMPLSELREDSIDEHFGIEGSDVVDDGEFDVEDHEDDWEDYIDDGTDPMRYWRPRG